MQRLALNASIRADHIGAPGNVLGVLADAMQKLASECAQRSASLVEALGSMSQAATRLSGQDGPAPAGNPGAAVEGMRTAVAGMHSWCERSFAQIAGIAAHSASLSEDLAAARGAFSVGALFAAAIGRARGALREIAGETPSGWRPAPPGRRPPDWRISPGITPCRRSERCIRLSCNPWPRPCLRARWPISPTLSPLAPVPSFAPLLTFPPSQRRISAIASSCFRPGSPAPF